MEKKDIEEYCQKHDVNIDSDTIDSFMRHKKCMITGNEINQKFKPTSEKLKPLSNRVYVDRDGTQIHYD